MKMKIFISVLALVTFSLISSTSSLGLGARHSLIRIVTDFTWNGIRTGKDETKAKGETTPRDKVENNVSCKDEEGNSVDWFIVYKLPKTPGSPDSELREGAAHYYLLPGSKSWKRSSLAINDSRSIVGKTMEPLGEHYEGKAKDLAITLYNDQPPGIDPTVRDGHTKGVMLADSKGGFWMPHSIPHFPRPNKTFDYPPGGLDNGQMLFCLSLPLQVLNDVLGGSLFYTKATFYNSSIPSSLEKSLEKIQDVVTRKKTASGPYNAQFEIPLKENVKVSVFAKGPKFHREIYADWIAPYYDSGLDVQSWLNGAHPFASNCTSNFSVLNIYEKTMLGQSFSYTNDHSKWAVGQPHDPVTCITDLNRQKPQKGRGGVALCLKDINVWTAFQSLVTKTEPCSSALSVKNKISSKKRRIKH